jgi:alpha-methylacyl-CoA racemase
MTGWGQDGSLRPDAGHDINYIALAGALEPIGRAGREAPVPPLNLVGDFGGGGMFLAFGVVCALLEAQRSGEGQVVDAAMVDGAAVLMTMFHAFKPWASGTTSGAPTCSTPAPTSTTSTRPATASTCRSARSSRSSTPSCSAHRPRATRTTARPDGPQPLAGLKERLAEVFRTKTRDEWCEIMEGTDVCFAPVLSMDEAPAHPHNVSGTFVEVAGVVQPAPAPRFSRTAPEIQRPPAHAGQHTDEVLGIPPERVDALLEAGAAKQA